MDPQTHPDVRATHIAFGQQSADAAADMVMTGSLNECPTFAWSTFDLHVHLHLKFLWDLPRIKNIKHCANASDLCNCCIQSSMKACGAAQTESWLTLTANELFLRTQFWSSMQKSLSVKSLTNWIGGFTTCAFPWPKALPLRSAVCRGNFSAERIGAYRLQVQIMPQSFPPLLYVQGSSLQNGSEPPAFKYRSACW